MSSSVKELCEGCENYIIKPVSERYEKKNTSVLELVQVNLDVLAAVLGSLKKDFSSLIGRVKILSSEITLVVGFLKALNSIKYLAETVVLLKEGEFSFGWGEPLNYDRILKMVKKASSIALDCSKTILWLQSKKIITLAKSSCLGKITLKFLEKVPMIAACFLLSRLFLEIGNPEGSLDSFKLMELICDIACLFLSGSVIPLAGVIAFSVALPYLKLGLEWLSKSLAFYNCTR